MAIGSVPLVPKSAFVGLDAPDAPVHLATGGEVPFLKRHHEALAEFARNKSGGYRGRERNFELYGRCKSRLGELLGVDAADIALLPSSSHAVQILRHGLDWRPGDNVVVADVEYPSLVYAWPSLAPAGVELRIVRRAPGEWGIPAAELARHVDGRTRALLVSQVSYLTGERYDLAELAAIAATGGGADGRPRTLLGVDATHAAGVMPVAARHADLLWSSCYKWLLGTHGLGVAYFNPAVWADRTPPFPSTQSATAVRDLAHPDRFAFQPDAARFETGNPAFIAVAVLDSALEVLLDLGIDRVGEHALALSGRVRAGCADLGYTVMTPAETTRRAGNVCLRVPDPVGLGRALEDRGVMTWYGDGRVRISTHVFNDTADVDRLLAALTELARTPAAV